jgi:DNA-binding MarR family transcriptional regulator
MSGVSSGKGLTGRTGFLVQKVAFLMINQFEERLAAHGLSSRSYFVLSGIDQQAPPSQQELARLLSIDPTTIVAMVDELERAGFVNRVRSSADRRRNELILTGEGAAALAKANRIADDSEAEFFAPLTATQRAELHDALVLLVKDRWPPPS